MSDSLNKIPVEVSLYESNEKIYPREIKGMFQNMRAMCVYALLGLYYVMPWIQWGERQAVLFDLPARKFHIFFLTFWPQDFIFLTLVLIMAGLLLFFATAIAGRVWCGYACPQTVWTEAFVWMERWVEGSRAQQMKLSAAPWSVSKIRKRFTKQFLWLTFSLFTGLTFVGYFSPISQLFVDFFTLELGGWALFWVLFYGFATYGNAGIMREQVCKYMCPYARFQSAMFDKDTLIVAYDAKRGEPRSKGKRDKDDDGELKGDCIECGICVQVCPTGIDIRDGLQYECIACAACIDGCDEVMEKVGLPKGLIRYSTDSQDHGDDKTLMQTLFRPRVIIYSVLLGLFATSFVTALAMRSNFQVDILRDRNAFYRYSTEGDIQNTYQIKIINKSELDQTYSLKLSGLEQATAAWTKPSAPGVSRTVGAGQIGDFSVTVSLPETAQARRRQTIELEFTELLGDNLDTIVEPARFWGPVQP